MKYLIIALTLLIFTGCDDVKELQETKYKNYPEVCKKFMQQYDGQSLRGRGGKLGRLDTIMEYCKFREENK